MIGAPCVLNQKLVVIHICAWPSRQVSEGQFRRALDQAGVTVSTTGGGPPVELLEAKEVGILIKRYRVKREGSNGDSDVDYGKLCEQVEKVTHPAQARIRGSKQFCQLACV